MSRKILTPMMTVYFLIIVGFAILLGYIRLAEYPETTNFRHKDDLYEVTEYETREVEDPDTPTGMYMEYSFRLPARIKTETWLFFFESHQYVRVLVDNELAFSMDNGNNRMGRSAGHLWATIPLEPTDSGKTVRVQLIPVYKGVLSSNLAFYLGPQSGMYALQFHKDIAAAILSFIVMTLGFVYLFVALRKRLRGGEGINELYLGTFCAQVGIWRMTDLPSAPLFFPSNTKALSYICLVALYLLPISMLRFLRGKIRVKQGWWLNLMAGVGILYNLVVFVLQIFQIRDLREMLPYFHVYVILCQITVICVSVMEILHEQSRARKYLSSVSMLFIASCVITDMVIFYQQRSAWMLFTMASVLVYVAAMGSLAAYQMNRQASRDVATGLYNKNRCINELSAERTAEQEDAVVMFDLNNLKTTNDTKGHEVGDAMIKAFAKALKGVMPASAFLGRYGGDEFIAIVRRTDESEVQTILQTLQKRLDIVNAADPILQVSVTEGHVLASEFPKYNYLDILEEADQRMYQNKRRWHKVRGDHEAEEDGKA